jgi:predicted transcriptional regulator of viral defense system
MRLPNSLVEIARANGGLATLTSARTAGVSSQQLTDLVRAGLIARVARGVYSIGSVTTSRHDPAHLTIAWRVALSGPSAVAWWGVDLPVAPGLLHVTAPRSRGRWRDAAPGVRLSRANLANSEIAILRGVRVTTPLRTALDYARKAPFNHAVAVVDAFLRAKLITAAEFDAAATAARGPGGRQLRLVAALADPASGSVLESLCRVLLWQNGLAPEQTQYPFKHPRTGWVGYLDFAWPTLKVALECDGYEWHADRDPFQRDRRRWSGLNRAGWRSGVVTWFDVTCDPTYVVALVRDLLELEGLAPAS